ncbi:hypothetical protein AM1_1258 [Acaryochloris marina MBIC11017]|uniref:Uncharacterized protein n=1 Tax=Acaryochloris marina (strain MBIC 11017) TaxID=329726 RepID=B0C435_ACAM1|nr:hypothetical protein AM1_1258 [Acaryochloris marina MBIC11017]
MHLNRNDLSDFLTPSEKFGGKSFQPLVLKELLNKREK